MVAHPQSQSIPVQHKSLRPERTPRVVSQATAARILGVHNSTICDYLDAGHLTPWFAPQLTGKKPRRMVTMASVDALIERGTIK